MLVPTWVFPKIGVGPPNGWFMMDYPIKMDDLGIPLFLETPTYSNKDLVIFVLGVSVIEVPKAELIKMNHRGHHRSLLLLDVPGTIAWESPLF